ncbi:hypothetical protein [uncultured Clostridium sp.]|nr:hypothetical protein [uncultured Clostridium sp.]
MRATRREEISNYLIYIKKEKEIFTMRKVKRIKPANKKSRLN